MDSSNEADRISDNDAAERPVREKLKKTSIATLPKDGIVPTNGEDAEGSTDGSTTSRRAEPQTGSDNDNNERGRSTRKRSFEGNDTEDMDIQHNGEEASNTTAEQGGHTRKRSRDIGAENDTVKQYPRREKSDAVSIDEGNEDHEGSNGPSTNEDGPPEQTDQERLVRSPTLEKAGVLSPRKKRSRDQFDKDLDKAGLTPIEAEPEQRKSLDEGEDLEMPAGRGSRSSRDEPEKKRHRDTSQGPAKEEEKVEEKVPPKSGFSDTSIVSPFGALARSKSPAGEVSSAIGSTSPTTNQHRATSPSAFAASGFAAMAGSSASPFGVLGSSSGFGALGSSGKPSGFASFKGDSDIPTNGTFGSGPTTSTGLSSPPGATSGFSGSTGFGTLGGSFGSPFGGVGGGLKSFASQGGPGIIGLNDKPARPFGTPANDEDEGDEDGEAAREGSAKPEEEHEKEEKRFRPQEVDTGEKGETAKFACRSKLYAFTGKEWKERGTGTFKLNIPEAGADGEGKKARLLMRTEQVYKVILNIPIKDLEVQTKGRSLTFIEVDEHSKPILLQLRTRNEDVAKEALEQIRKEQENL
ncbi:MAG: hypothetical protein M1819_003225 [Sarea resinae]|nr:MAG: hypothetical protein M1819_003225 [Sarea resinae]